MAREHRAQAVMDDREYRLVQEAARASGETVSSFIRAAALSAAVETLKEQDELEEEAEDAETDSG